MDILIVLVIIAIMILVAVLRSSDDSESPPSPSPSEPNPSPTPTPSSNNLMTTVDRSNSSFISTCTGGSVAIPELQSSFVVNGGSGDYTISFENCHSQGTSICEDIIVETGSDNAMIKFPEKVYENCPLESGYHDAVVSFRIVDNVTGDVAFEGLTILWEIV
jgi:hypothetical protein